MTRGKYTFENSVAFVVKVLEDSVRQSLKKFQSVMPARLNKNGGTVPVEIEAILLKTSVKIIDVNSG
tara:strand:+ start:131 stop:331 length:201 start_codon:yes stop_codon:yes gene_type:complete